MSAENELFIYLRMEAAQAEATSRAYHKGEQQRIRETAETDAKTEKEKSQGRWKTLNSSVQMARAAQKDLEEIAKRELAGEQEKNKAKLALLRQQLKEGLQASNEARQQDLQGARATEQAKLDLLRLQLKQGLQASNDSNARRLQSQQESAQKELALLRQQLKDGLNLSTDAINREKQAVAEAASAKKEILADFAREDARAERSLEADFNAVQRKMVSINKQGLREQTRDKQDAFRTWKQEHMNAHKLAMMQWDEQQEATKKTTGGILSIANAYTSLRVASEIGQMIAGVFNTVAQSTNQARDYVEQLVAKMEQARTIVKELANLEGRTPSATYTAEVAERAAATGTDVADYVAGQKAMQANAAQYIGKEGATEAEQAQEKKLGMLTFEDSQRLNKDWATNLSAQGLKQDLGMQLMGTMLSKKKSTDSVEDIERRGRRLIEIAKRSKGETGPMLEQMNEVIAESSGEGGDFKEAEDAAIATRIVAERNPKEASAYVRAAVRQLREIESDPKKEELREALGLKKGMDFFQKVESISKKAKEYEDSGQGTQNEFLTTHGFKEARAFGGIHEAITTGIKNGGVARARKELDDLAPDTLEKENKAGLANNPAMVDATRRSTEEAAKLRRAATYVDLQEWKHKGRLATISSGEVEDGQDPVNAAATKSREAQGWGTWKEQTDRRHTAEGLEQALQGSEEGRKFLETKPWSMGEMASENDLNKAAQIVKRQRDKFAKENAKAPAFNPKKSNAQNLATAKALRKPPPVEAKDIERASLRVAFFKTHPEAKSDERAFEKYEKDRVQPGWLARMSGVKTVLPDEDATSKYAANNLFTQEQKSGLPYMKPRSIPVGSLGLRRDEGYPEYHHRQSERLAEDPKIAQETMKRLNEAAKNLKDAASGIKKAVQPQVRTPIPGKPNVITR